MSPAGRFTGVLESLRIKIISQATLLKLVIRANKSPAGVKFDGAG